MNKDCKVSSVGNDGLRGFIVSIETVVRRGIFQFDIVGLANKTVSESKQRILSAIQSCSIESPRYSNKKIITLLSPADDKKEGAHFDLPIAISYLSTIDYFELNTSEIIFIGELTLHGQVRPVKNIKNLISIAVKNKFRYMVIPQGHDEDIHEFKDVLFYKVNNLITLIESLKIAKRKEDFYLNFINELSSKNKKEGGHETQTHILSTYKKYTIDSIDGLMFAKRALLIALSGKHHIVFIGQPGVGKSLLAKSAEDLIQPITVDRGLKKPSIHTCIDISAPFREPHHTSSYSTVLGSHKNEGEILLANGGILFFDELVEFNRRVLESMRQPLEDGYIIHPELGKIPSDFVFIGSMNPCGCGYKNSKDRRCVCNRNQIERYQRKIQSPLFERINIKVNIHRENDPYKNTNIQSKQLYGKKMRDTILKVREVQKKRILQIAYRADISEKNTHLYTKELKILLTKTIASELDSKTQELWKNIIYQLKISRREKDSLLLISRTVADIDQSETVKEKHILESLSYRGI